MLGANSQYRTSDPLNWRVRTGAFNTNSILAQSNLVGRNYSDEKIHLESTGRRDDRASSPIIQCCQKWFNVAI
jgi:hypothetical protein